MSDKYSLKWNDFHTNVSKSFGLFRNESYLQDVTLVSDDFKQYSAHKLVLSACSDHFRNIFQETKHPNPLLCLEGVSSANLKNVLDYVYDGEVRILQEDLDSFLFIANRLKLNGLFSEDIVKPDYNDQQLEIGEIHNNQQASEVNDVSTTKHTRPSKDKSLVTVKDEFKTKINQTYEENVEAQMDGSLLCKLCGKVVSKTNRNRVANMKIHMEIHTEGLIYDCKFCDKTLRSSNSLNAHIYNVHRNK